MNLIANSSSYFVRVYFKEINTENFKRSDWKLLISELKKNLQIEGTVPQKFINDWDKPIKVTCNNKKSRPIKLKNLINQKPNLIKKSISEILKIENISNLQTTTKKSKIVNSNFSNKNVEQNTINKNLLYLFYGAFGVYRENLLNNFKLHKFNFKLLLPSVEKLKTSQFIFVQNFFEIPESFETQETFLNFVERPLPKKRIL